MVDWGVQEVSTAPSAMEEGVPGIATTPGVLCQSGQGFLQVTVIRGLMSQDYFETLVVYKLLGVMVEPNVL